MGKLLAQGCLNCGEKGPHYYPPSMGDPGGWLCEKKDNTVNDTYEPLPQTIVVEDGESWADHPIKVTFNVELNDRVSSTNTLRMNHDEARDLIEKLSQYLSQTEETQ